MLLMVLAVKFHASMASCSSGLRKASTVINVCCRETLVPENACASGTLEVMERIDGNHEVKSIVFVGKIGIALGQVGFTGHSLLDGIGANINPRTYISGIKRNMS